MKYILFKPISNGDHTLHIAQLNVKDYPAPSPVVWIIEKLSELIGHRCGSHVNLSLKPRSAHSLLVDPHRAFTQVVEIVFVLSLAVLKGHEISKIFEFSLACSSSSLTLQFLLSCPSWDKLVLIGKKRLSVLDIFGTATHGIRQITKQMPKTWTLLKNRHPADLRWNFANNFAATVGLAAPCLRLPDVGRSKMSD